ncbi:MAG: thioredoxin family protein [Deltaproteobacteria bacterium]|nr:thioredoxin family protein [Deltaproteobacteria bacterium]
MRRLLLVIPVVAFGCSKSDKGTEKDTPKAVSAACAKAKVEGTMAWIEDDYPAALACAKEKNLPLVIDLWAPWCHTCLSMKATVFTDASFKPDAEKFVFAAIDTDREVNAPVVQKFPLSAWPTFYVVGTDESVLARWVGAASTSQFHAFLDAGADARDGVDGPGKHLLAAERALATKTYDVAEKELTAALAAAPPDWVRRPDALLSLLSTISRQKDDARCLTFAIENMGKTGSSSTAADFVATALSCASNREKEDAAGVTALRTAAIARLEGLLAETGAPLSVDDRSDAMVILRETYAAVGRKDDAKALAEKQRALIDEAAARATSPMAAMTFNWQRAEVYVYLGRPLEVVPALEKSAADLPEEYDPPARLGWVYLKGGKLAEAATWTDRALKLAYGPRKARVLSQRAEIANKQGDAAAEKKFRAEAVALWESLPPGQASPDALAKAKEALSKLDAPAPTASTN